MPDTGKCKLCYIYSVLVCALTLGRLMTVPPAGKRRGRFACQRAVHRAFLLTQTGSTCHASLPVSSMPPAGMLYHGLKMYVDVVRSVIAGKQASAACFLHECSRLKLCSSACITCFREHLRSVNFLCYSWIMWTLGTIRRMPTAIAWVDAFCLALRQLGRIGIF